MSNESSLGGFVFMVPSGEGRFDWDRDCASFCATACEEGVRVFVVALELDFWLFFPIGFDL